MSELDKMPMGEFYKQLTVTLTDRLVEADDKLDALRSELSRLREQVKKVDDAYWLTRNDGAYVFEEDYKFQGELEKLTKMLPQPPEEEA